MTCCKAHTGARAGRDKLVFVSNFYHLYLIRQIENSINLFPCFEFLMKSQEHSQIDFFFFIKIAFEKGAISENPVRRGFLPPVPLEEGSCDVGHGSKID